MQIFFKKARYFSLLELLVVISLMILISSVVGVKVHASLQRRSFVMDQKKLLLQCALCQRLAQYTHEDWVLFLHQTKKGWSIEMFSEGQKKSRPSLTLHPFLLKVDGEECASLALHFFSTGKILPHGKFLLQTLEETQRWEFPEILGTFEESRVDMKRKK